MLARLEKLAWLATLLRLINVGEVSEGRMIGRIGESGDGDAV